MTIIKKLALSFVTLFSFISHPALADFAINMRRGVTPISKEIYHLHMTIFWICVVIGVIVFGVMIYALIFHRKSKGAVAAEFHSHTALEIVWAIIPFLILVGMAIPATKVLMAMENPAQADITIRVTGFQWKWQYEYLDEGIRFFSNLATPFEQYHDHQPKNPWYLLEVDNPLILPINKKIRFVVTSNDVIHSWWVPELGIKRDAMPGFINEAWARIQKPGIYRGQCAELCGLNHGFMPIVVKAVAENEYNAWVTEQTKQNALKKAASKKKYTLSEQMKTGEAAFNKTCSVCHKTDGTGSPPTFPPLKASSVATGKNISRHIKTVLNGVPNTAMQAFGKQLSDDEIAAIITYERNAWGNNTGDVIQPSDVATERNK